MRLSLFYRAIFSIITAVFMLVVLLNTRIGVLYDTDHFGDTQFLLGAAWRAHEGLTPAIDFGHFYGGIMAQGLSWTMSVFGHGVFAFDYFTLLLSVFLGACAFVILRPQISWTGLAMVVAVIATLLLTRFPLEVSDSIIRLVSTHSFLYNRFSLAVFLVLGLFVACPAPTKPRDIANGVLAGVLLGLVCLTKPTFAILPLGFFLALLIWGRWRPVLGSLGGLALVVLVFDPTLGRFMGSFDYALAHVGDSNGVTGLIRKAIQVPLGQPIALSLALGGLCYLVFRQGVTRHAIALLVFAGFGVALTTTMGGNGSLGQLCLPIAIMITLAVSEMTRRHSWAQHETYRLINVCLILAFCVPHLLNLLGVTAEGIAKRNQLQITQGPFADYLSLPENAAPEEVTQYDTLADGMTALQSLGDPTQWGIVADNGVTFEYALLARPVPGYPLWQRVTAPELAADQPFAPGADIVLLRPLDQQDPLGVLLRDKIANDFVLCTKSRHWEIYKRTARDLPSCDAL